MLTMRAHGDHYVYTYNHYDARRIELYSRAIGDGLGYNTRLTSSSTVAMTGYQRMRYKLECNLTAG